ncbi:MAG: AMP-binding protein [Proteobacteria bacterium]|nr:AMP-binding protein [Pseudomonadota bacterium]MBU2469900.1 AMP-binding protein [Pseudomonadota bacterium]MBU2516138.1 AMP-binding protein [Pseudomonadota bacterium]
MERARIASRQEGANLPDYTAARRHFSWSQCASEFSWSQSGQINIAFEAIDRWALGAKAGHTALIYAQGGDSQTISFRHLHRESCRLANLLASLGLEQGQSLAIFLPAAPEIFFAQAACARLGVAYCCLSPHLTRDQLRQQLASLAPAAVITDPVLSQRLPWGFRPAGTKVLYTSEPAGGMDPGDLCLPEAMRGQPTEHEPCWVGAEHPLFITFANLPEGPAKGVVHTHGDMAGQLMSARWVLDLKEHSVLWCDLEPWGIASMVYGAWAPWLCGVTSLAQAAPMVASTWYHTLEAFGITTLYTSPERLRLLAGAGDDLPGRYDLSRLEHLATLGEPLGAKLFFWTRNQLGLPPHDTWWSAFTGIIALANLPSLDIRLASCGKPLPGIEAAVVDGQGRPQPLLTLGQLSLRPDWPGLAGGFWDRGRMVPLEQDPNQWLRTGDLALTDEDGYFYVQGRADDLIRVQDHMVGPYEMEQLLLDRPAVEQAAVIARPGPENRPVFKAFVVLAPGRVPSTSLRRELLEDTRSRLAPLTPLADLEFVEALPRNASGRLLRRALRAADLGLPLGDTSRME